MFLRLFYFFSLLKVQFWQIMDRKKYSFRLVMFDNILPQLPLALYRDSTEVARKNHYIIFIQFVEQSAESFFSL